MSEIKNGYTIGITIFVNEQGKLSLFENGLRQNVLFLYHMFKAAPNCKRVFLLNHGDGEPIDPMGEANIPPHEIVRSTDAVISQLDYVLSIGAAMDVATVNKMKARGIPVISYKCGNGGVIAMEATCAHPPRKDAERYFDANCFDQIWMTPQHIHTYKGWCETLYRCPVEEVPQVWNPYFIHERPAAIRERFGYKPGARPWSLTVMDPNITVMKTSHMPMLVCEAAYRLDPEAFKAFYITNGQPHTQNAQFVGFYRYMQAAQAGKMTLEPRFVSADILANHTDAVVTHHWENGLNYLYYEVLYGNYPFFHNSQFLKDYGYYYPDWDPMKAGEVIVAAHKNHDNTLEDYAKKNAQLIARLSPESSGNILLHERKLVKASQIVKAKRR
jgi:Protein of unknown function (DUF2827)